MYNNCITKMTYINVNSFDKIVFEIKYKQLKF